MKRIGSYILTLLVWLSASHILAGEATFSFPKEREPFLSLRLPDAWRGEWQRGNSDDIFVAVHAIERDLSLRLADVPGIMSFDDLPAQMTTALDRFVTGLSVDDESWQLGVFDELPIMYVEVRGKDKRTGKAAACFASFLQMPSDRFVLLLISGSDDALARYKGDVNHLIDNLQVQHAAPVIPPENEKSENDDRDDTLPAF